MREEIPKPVVIGVLVVVLLVVGVLVWRGLFGRTQIVTDPSQMPPNLQRALTNPAGRPSR